MRRNNEMEKRHDDESIDYWRYSIPSRLDREDPFADDGFGIRPSTRLVCLSVQSRLEIHVLTFHRQ